MSELVAKSIGSRIGGRTLWERVDERFATGSVCAVVGRNGSGKSTLLRALVGLLAPTQGRVELEGQALDALDPLVRARRIAYLPQRTVPYHDLVVRDLVGLGRAPWQRRFGGMSGEDLEAVEAALRRVQLESLAERRISTLSGGERQRVLIARMLAGRAPVLVLDEPSAALDIAHALAVLELCRELAADDHAIVLAIHDLELARRYADRVVCLGVDEAGAHLSGAADEVLRPDTITRAFGVRVDEGWSFSRV